MNDTINLLLQRKSVRAYEPVQIPEEDVKLILETAVQAPSGGNMTLWSCIRVIDAALKQELSDMCDHQPFIAKAPLVLMFYADYSRWLKAFNSVDVGEPLRPIRLSDRMCASVDTVIAAQSAVIAAEALGYGSCYIGDVVENWEWHRETFGIPEHVQPVCMVVIGIPTEQQKERQKPARFHVDDLVFENKYGDVSTAKARAMLAERQGYETDADLDHWLKAFINRKWNAEYCVVRACSIDQMFNDWLGKNRR